MFVHQCKSVNGRDALIEEISRQECYINTGLKIFIERYQDFVEQLEQLEQEDIVRLREIQRQTTVTHPTPPGQAQSPFSNSNNQGIDADDFDENDYLVSEGLDPAYIWKFYSDDENDDDDEYESESEGDECVNDHLQERICVRRDCHQFGFCREHELSAVCVCNGDQ